MLIGKRISGRYKILKVIGGGGMANVYLARDIILERDVAIKILRLDFSDDDEFIRRFRREAQSATSLAHPNIVSIYDVGEEDNIYYIVMEYVEGKTLKQYIQQNAPLHPREALNLMEQIVSAIAHAHENQIVHRDIKPHNILIDNLGNIKVTDFGIAMALTSTTITHTNSVLGSVHYLSPEQARGQIATKKSDIYSLGIVLYEMLTGRLPFDGESAVSIALKHLQSEAPSPKRWNPEIPQSVENIILKAMAKDPLHRYSSAEEMGEDIRTAFNTDRLDEKKFEIPDNDEKTITHPIILHDIPETGEQTIIHHAKDRKSTGAEKEQKHENIVSPKKKRKWLKMLWMATAVVIIAIILALLVLPKLILPKDVEVPDVRGKTYEEAVNQLLKEGFDVKDTILLENDEIEEGYVIRTEPEAGEMVEEGSSIIIYESAGKKKVTLDNYIGKDIERVRQLLEVKGFSNITVLEEYSGEEEGTVIDQSPSEGAELIPDEDEITLTVSKGLRKITLADLTGYTEEAVKDYVEKEGLSFSKKEEHSDEVPAGQVISQSPSAGKKVLPGEKIEVVISLGPEEKPDKKVVREVEIPFDPEIHGEEAEVGIYINDAEHSIGEPYETFKISKPTKKKIELTIQPGQSAYYQVLLNNEVVKTETVPYPEN
ncbi:serine/threonine-protein kinase [Aeribacillus composti]|uniref:Stk1 family PASTA domain-containing Ser/Thr kinase n=1 Tax=Aeribacillus composti TaxID=1868734 RepID=UPI00119C7965|nr:Stk1 family PASTA domain-containing Ser/Thr kinase [Aeribacillus composti]TVZ83044.1 serine/threonine-protein kinase [Aeribacillus composti]